MGRTDKPEAELYCIRWVVMEDSDLVGHTWRGHGLLRLSGTRLESVSRRAPGGEAPPVPEDQVLEAGDVLVARCDAADVSKLRHVRGLLIAGDAGEAVRRLGANRRRRGGEGGRFARARPQATRRADDAVVDPSAGSRRSSARCSSG